jgi:hypothetical protein
MKENPSVFSSNRKLEKAFERACIETPDIVLRQLTSEAYDAQWKFAQNEGLSNGDCIQFANMKTLLWRYESFPDVRDLPFDKKIEVVKWEASPFNLLPQNVGRAALVEYMVWKEFPDQADLKILVATLENLVRHLKSNDGEELLEGFRNAPFFSWLPWKKLIPERE